MKIWIPILGAVFLLSGLKSVFNTLRNQQPAEFTIDQYIDSNHKARYVKLTGCYMDLGIGAYSRSIFTKDRADKIYVPVYAEGYDESSKSSILLEISDYKSLRAINKINSDIEFDSTDFSEIIDLIFRENISLIGFRRSPSSDEKKISKSCCQQIWKIFISFWKKTVNPRKAILSAFPLELE